MTRVSGSEDEEEETRDPCIISARNISVGSSSLRVGRSMFSDTHDGWPLVLPVVMLSRAIALSSPCWRKGCEAVFSTSALTPTIASLPSLKLRWAEPLVAGKTSVSALSGRKAVADLESGLIGGVSEREAWRYESSAGERANDGMVSFEQFAVPKSRGEQGWCRGKAIYVTSFEVSTNLMDDHDFRHGALSNTLTPRISHIWDWPVFGADVWLVHQTVSRPESARGRRERAWWWVGGLVVGTGK